MSHAEFVASLRRQADAGDWLAELSLLDPNDDELVLRFSRHGTTTGPAMSVDGDTIAARTSYRRRLIQRPTWSQSLWASGSILSRSFPNYGAYVLRNQDGELDQYRPREGYTWADRPTKCYYGEGQAEAIKNLAATIERKIAARMGRPQFRLATVTVPLLGYESRFDRLTSSSGETATPQRIYRGGDYQLELFGDRTVTFGSAPAALDITGALTWETWLWLEALPTSNRRFIGWFGGAVVPWIVFMNSAGTMSLGGFIGGVEEVKTSAATLAPFTPYHVSFTVSAAGAVTFELWNEDAQTLTTETLTSFSSGTRQAQSGSQVVIRTASDANFRPWVDELRVWNVARTAAERAAYRHSSFAAGAIPSSLKLYARMDDGTGTAVTDSSATGANGTISGGGTSTWLHTYQGAKELAGTSVPDLWGQRFGVRPVLVNPIDNGYQINGGSTEEIVNVYAGGLDDYDLDGDAASMRAFIVATVAPGHRLTYLARGLYRLGSAPTLPTMVTAKGYNNGDDGYVDTLADIMWDVARERGPQLDPATEFDDASRTAFNTATGNAVAGVFLPAPINMMEFNDLLARSGAGWWGYVRGSTELHVERYVGPAATADHNFDNRHIVDEPREIEWQPVGEVVVKYQKSDVVLDEGKIAGAVQGTDGWQRFTKEWLEERRSDPDANPAASRVVVVETALYNQADAAVLADYLLAALKGEKEGWGIVVSSIGLQVIMGQTVTLRWERQDGSGTTRLGLDGTVRYVVLAANDNENGTVTLELLSA